MFSANLNRTFRRALPWTSTFGALGIGYWLGNYKLQKTEMITERQELFADPDVHKFVAKAQENGYKLYKPNHSWIMNGHRQLMFTKSILTGPDHLHPEGPLTLIKPETSEFVSIFHVGKALKSKEHFTTCCTALFDECLTTAGWSKLPHKIGVTGSLKLEPIAELPKEEDIIVLHARPTKADGRKVEAEGVLLTLKSNKLLGSGTAVIIEPSWGKYLSWIA